MALRSMASRLAFGVLAGTLLVVVVGGMVLFHFVRQQILEQTHRQSAALASDAGHRIQHRLDKVADTAQMLAALIGPRPDDAEWLIRDAIAHNADLAGLAAAYVPSTSDLGAPDRSPFVSRLADGSLAERDLRKDPVPYWEQPWFGNGLNCSVGCWQQPFFSQSRQRRLVNYSVAIRMGGQPAGVLNADVTLEWLQGVLQSLNRPQGTEAFVIDPKGIYLANDDPRQVGQPARDELLAALRAGGDGPIRQTDAPTSANQGPVWIYRAPLGGTRWQFGMVVPEDRIYAGVRRTFSIVIGVGVLALLSLTLLTLVVTRRTLSPLGVLAERAEQVARGALDFALPAVRRRDEVGRLTHAFDRMRHELADHIAELGRVAREQARLASELEIAQQIQTALLPGAHFLDARCNNFELHAVLKPARTVGGDLYSYFMLHDQRFYVMVGDVSDKGIPAALFMARAITLAKALAPRAQSPQQLLQLLNQDLCRNNDGCMFVSLLCGLLDTGTGHLTMASAGHEPPVLWGSEAPHLLELETGPALGLDEEATYTSRRIRLRPGETLVMYTDGITEATDASLEMYGPDRMLACLQRYAMADEGDPAGFLLADVEAFAAGHGQADDITVLALRWHHAGTEGSASMLELTMPASLEAAFDALDQCDARLLDAAVDAGVRADVRLVLEELMVNMVEHGRPATGDAHIELRMSLAADAVLVELHHDGQPFNPLLSPSPELTGDIADREIDGGLGIHLVRAMASDFSYAHDEQGNHLQLRFIHPH